MRTIAILIPALLLACGGPQPVEKAACANKGAIACGVRASDGKPAALHCALDSLTWEIGSVDPDLCVAGCEDVATSTVHCAGNDYTLNLASCEGAFTACDMSDPTKIVQCTRSGRRVVETCDSGTTCAKSPTNENAVCR